ncbi:hypothetical protein ZIOFF_040596 [Zingiber officinale]|uniref:Uncharacterized protein n=1 Tax=Zingiber officinale TaxID=94328 RepID=A0A8J5G6H3_ZINOF|nr:hypothetical protein ZIOFF_040596 [Zingiber officinale]
MVVSRLLIASIAIYLLFIGVGADATPEEELAVVEHDASDSALKLELEQLRSKILALESNIADTTRDLKSKNETIANLGKTIEEKSATIQLLQSEIETVQKKGAGDAQELVKKAHARAGELEKQVEKLTNEIELQNKRRDDLDSLAREAEKKVQELNLKLEKAFEYHDLSFVGYIGEDNILMAGWLRGYRVFGSHAIMVCKQLGYYCNANLWHDKIQLADHSYFGKRLFAILQKANEEQKLRIRKTEHALQVAEEELMKAQLEVTTKSKVLSQMNKYTYSVLITLKVHGAWLPPWLATHTDRYQKVVLAHWKDHGKPALDAVVVKVCEKGGQAKNWAAPYIKMVKIWALLAANAEPYVQTLSTKTTKVYHVSKNTASTYAVKAHKLLDPYLKEARKVSRPYINHVATITKPYVEKLKIALRPYTKRVVRTYRKFHKSTTTYHRQIPTLGNIAQAGIYRYLKKNDLTKRFATKELAWFMASALFVLPVFLAYRLLCDIFMIKSRKTKRPARKVEAEANHTNRRPKRRHADK